MTTGDLLARLDRAGIRLRAEAGRLLYDAPAGALTPELREALKRHKAELIARLGPDRDPAGSPGMEGGAPLSFPQQGLWLIEEMQPGHTGSSEQFVLGLKGSLDVAALARAWSHLLSRHDILRTRFRITPDGVRQCADPADPHDPVPLLPVTPLADAGDLVAAAARELAIPFDASRGPLVRPRLFRRGPADHVLVVTAHHAVADGFSVPVLHRELAALYGEAVTREPAKLPPVGVQYAEFAARAAGTRDDGDRDRRLAAWRGRLSDLPPPVLGGLVRPAPSAAGPSVSRRVPFTVPPELAVAVRRFARSRNATPFMVMLAAFRALLARLSGQADLVIGTPLTLRDRPELREAVGCYVNPVALRALADPDQDFATLVDRERATVLAALEDRHLPFAAVVAAVAPERRVGEHPLFQVLFSLEQDSAGECRAGGVVFRRESVAAERASWFHLELGLVESPGGDGYSGSLAWNQSVLEDFVATALPSRWLTLLADALERPAAPLHTLALMTTDECRRVLERWNATAAPWPGRDTGTDTLHAQVLRQCAATPEAPALLAQDQSVLLRYGELATLSGALARRLREQGIAPGTPVGLALPRSPELVVAWLALLRAGAVAVPLDPGYPAERLRHIANDAGLGLVLTGVPTGPGGRNPAATLPAGLPVEAVNLPQLAAAGSREAPADAAGPGDPVCILYTSGSTGAPKGAVQHHRGAVNRCHWMWRRFGFDARHRFALRTSPNFVDSLWEIFGALMHGIPLVVIPDEVATDPAALPAALAAGGVTHTVLVPALLRALLEADGARHLGGLRSAITSGEPLAPSLARQLRAALPDLTLFNTYGTSEIWDATCHEVTAADGEATRVPIGRPIANARCHVLDARGQPLPPGIPGELWVGGVGVGPGYWRQPALTDQRFLPDHLGPDHFAVPDSDRTPSRLYRTGDLARWLPDGTLECLGRLDGQVKLRGHRIELAEIESALLAQPGVAAAAVTLVTGEGRHGQDGGWLLAAVVGRETPVPPAEAAAPVTAEIKARLRESLPEYMVPRLIAWLPRLPLTPSGKVDRRALPAVVGALPSTDHRDDEGGPPATLLEQRLAGMWCELLGREQVGRHANFFDLGGHSLIASRLVQRLGPVLAEHFGPDRNVHLGLRDVFTHPTLKDLASLLQARAGSAARDNDHELSGLPAPASAPVPGAAPADHVPLSFSQERLWFLDQLDPASPAYNIAWTVRLTGTLDQVLLRRCLEALVTRHEALRMAFPGRDGVPVGMIRPAGDFCRDLPFEVVGEVAGAVADVGALLAARARQPFSLATGPLVRFVLVPDGPLRDAPAAHLLLVVIHHIVSDATANHLLFGELAACYEAGLEGREPSLPPLPFRHADYAAWQRTRPWPATDLPWWRQQLAGAPESLDLPTDRPRPAEQKFRGAWVTRRLRADRAAALRALGRDHGTSLFPVLLAAFQALLHRWSGSTDILTGTPVEGRAFPGGDQLVGLFINTVVIRTDLAGDPPFAVLLDQVRDRALSAQAHQGLPFEQLVEALAPTRSLSRSPVFQVLFNLVRLPERSRVVGEGLGALTLSLDRLVDLGVSPFDLTLTAAEHREGLDLIFEYDTDLFDAGTVEAFASQFDTFIGAVLEDPSSPVSRLGILAPAEAERLVRWSGSGRWPATVDPEAVPPVLATILHWCRTQPRAPAVSDLQGDSLSYGELERRSAALAHWLLDQGLGAGHRIGIGLPRSPAYLVAVLGVLRAGAAYVPLDPDYPAARRDFMVKDAALALVLDGDAVEAGGLALPAGDLPLPAADDPAYLVYTSGSTGEPKGVVVSHGNLAALAAAWREVYRLEPGEAHLQMASAAFDVFAGDWIRALTSGGELVICPREVLLEPAALHRTLVERRIRVAEFVPAVIRELLAWLAGSGARLPALRLVAVGSDTWTLAEYRAMVNALDQSGGHRTRVVNSYGVAEATVDSTVFEAGADEAALLDRLGDGPVPIGRPFPGVVVEIRDEHGQPLPPGIPGELWIGGAGVAAGYHQRPALTAERFVRDEAGRRWYRTGDRARWRADGLLELRGRLDSQLKLRGQRIEPGEIEGALRCLPGIADAAVVLAPASRPEEARLVAWLVRSGAGATPISPAEEDALARALRARLPAHLVPARFAAAAALPLSPNGKVDRRALANRPLPPAPEGSGPESPGNSLETRLARLFADALDRKAVGRHQDFFALGGHSLLATRLAARIREAFHVDLPLKAFFEAPTVAGIAAWVEAHGDAEIAVPVPRPPGTDRLPLSLAQQRLWFLEQLQPGGSAWHLHQVLRLAGVPDSRALATAVGELLDRHESLRTVFEMVEGVPVQRVLAPDALAASVLRVEPGGAGSEADDLRIISETPFDLARGPLWRVVVLTPREGTDTTLLVLVIHHLIADGWSLGVLFRELSAGYRRALKPVSTPLPAPSLQFGDWALWQRQWLEGGEGARQLSYWRRQLADPPPPLELWGARSRPDPDADGDDGMGPGRGSWHTVQLPRDLLASLRTLAAAEGCTLFNVVLAGFALVLGRYAGREDLLVGTPVAGRQHTALEGLIGCFVNTLPLRTDLRGNPTVAELLGRVKATAVEAFAHQDLPFEKLVEALNPVRSLRHSPLVQVQLAFHNQPRESLDLAGLPGETVFLQGDAVKFDLGVHLAEEADGLTLAVGYREALYTAGWARDFAARYAEVLAALGESGSRGTGRIRVAELGLPPAKALSLPAGPGTLTAAFAERLAKCPKALAVQDEAGAWTYAELAARAGGLGAALKAGGVMAGDRVGLVLQQGRGAVAALLGVLAAGAVAVPLDPAAPPSRRRAQAADAGVKRLVVDGDGTHPWEPGDAPRLELADLDAAPFDPVPVSPEHLAYLLYTSGTTGEPKAVAQTHGNASGWFRRWAANLAIGPGDRLSLCATLGYDAALQDLFGALLAGASVHPLDVRGQSPGELRERLRREGITILHATPTVFRYLFGGADDGAPDSGTLPALRAVVLGGEAARTEDLALARRCLPGAGFVNGYGLTEATAVLQWFAPAGARLHGDHPEGNGPDGDGSPGADLLPVGRALPGVSVSIEDGDGGPATVAGELVIHGGGVTPGYWDGRAGGPRPRANRERFATGDRMRRLPDGQWLWLGRNDDQVKVAGNRLALGEVEAALTGCPGVEQACALLVADTLVAVVTGDAHEADLRLGLRQRLPAWALPARIQSRASLPVLPNGKVDRRALKAELAAALPGAAPTGGDPAGDDAAGARTLPPDTVALLDLWQQLLPGAALGPDTDFFAAGGHSLLAMSLVARIRERFGVELPLIRIFEAPTVRGLASALETALVAARAAPPATGSGPGPIRPLGRRARR